MEFVLKFTKPTSSDVAKVNSDNQKKKEFMKSMKPGQTAEWESKKLGKTMKGEIIAAGRSKVKINVDGSVWTVPVPLITKVDGKKVK